MIMSPDILIIRRSHRQSSGHKLASLVLAVGYWGWLAYLLKGLAVIAGWGTAWGLTSLIATRTSFSEMLRQAVGTYLPLILGLATLLWSWAFYNWLRFHGRGDKRREAGHPSPNLEDISRACSLEVDVLKCIRESRLGVYHFDDHGNICGIECAADLNEAERLLRPRPEWLHTPDTAMNCASAA